MKLRVASSSLLYRKALKLSNTALGQTTVGQMVNLLSNDVKRFDNCGLTLHYLWAGPLQLTIITALLYQRLGPSALVGAALLIAAVPLQSIGNIFSSQPVFSTLIVLLCMHSYAIKNQLKATKAPYLGVFVAFRSFFMACLEKI